MKFISVVPAVRTIPGVEQFDYAIPDDAVFAIGDVLRVPFRKRQIPALVIAISATSPFADKAILIDTPSVVASFGEHLVTLLQSAAERSFTSQPSVFASWIRSVPKRVPVHAQTDTDLQSSQPNLPVREARFFIDRWRAPNALLEEARRPHGKTLILTPWLHRADLLAEELGVPVLHSDIADGAAWKAAYGFARGDASALVATRIGTWLACFADTVLIDEPENDDFKQDEMSPRLDARWILTRCAELRPNITLISFGTTPRLKTASVPPTVPDIDPNLTMETWTRRSGSPIETLSPQSIHLAQEALEEHRRVLVVHPVKGDRAKLACRDCGWTAMCSFCQFHLSPVGTSALCKRCGRKSPMPFECANCGGTDLSRGLPGKERLAAQCATYFKNENVTVIDPLELDALACAATTDHVPLTTNSLLIVTDLSLIGGAAEDIRRKERLAIAWRRLAAFAEATKSELHVQGPEELVVESRNWLSAAGLKAVWTAEFTERSAFGYPPAVPFAKLLIDGTEQIAAQTVQKLQDGLPSGWSVRGPFPVPFRSYTRKSRFAVHVQAPAGTAESAIISRLDSFKKSALIDLDPIAFFG